ncbi:alpha/beta hydrolase, partial [Legionella israelensis]
ESNFSACACPIKTELIPLFKNFLGGSRCLYDEGLAFAEKVKNLNVPITLENFKCMIHAFAQLEKLVPEQVMRLVDSIGSFIKRQKANG